MAWGGEVGYSGLFIVSSCVWFLLWFETSMLVPDGKGEVVHENDCLAFLLGGGANQNLKPTPAPYF